MEWGRGLIALGVAALLWTPETVAEPPPELGAAASFAVLGATVQSRGATVITGNLGADRVSGFPPGTVQVGTILQKALSDARRDVATLRAAVASRSCEDLPIGAPGVHCIAVDALSGAIVLDARGDKDAVWIFRTDGHLATAPGTKILVAGGGNQDHVFWIANDAPLGENTAFIGNVLTQGDITLNAGVTVSGRLLSLKDVTLNGSAVSLCCAPITVTPQSLPDATAGAAYGNIPLSATGGLAPYTFRISSGTPPPGLDVIGTTLRGTPSASGPYTFTIDAIDAHGCVGTAAYEVNVAPCPTPPELPPLPQPTAGIAYQASLTPSGGVPPYTYSISGTLPAGLSPPPPNGVMSGTPAVNACSSTFTVTVTDAFGCKGSRTYTFCFPLTFSPDVLPPAIVGTPYQPVVTASCGAMVTRPEVTLDRVCTFAYTVTATEPVAACGPTSRTYIVDAVCPSSAVLPATLPNGTVGVPYPDPLNPALKYSIVGAPPGLGPRLSGTPTKSGSYRITVTAADALGCTITRTYPPITISCPPIEVTPATLPPGTAGVFHCVKLFANGAPGTAVTFTVDPMPTGMSIVGNVFSGRPAAGVYAFVITATDEASDCVATRAYTWTVNAAPPPPLPSPPGTPVPALSAGAMIALVVLLALAAMWRSS